MKKTKLMRAALLLLVLTLITSCFVGGTFAKYTTGKTAVNQARVAEFGVEVTAKGDMFSKTYVADDTTAGVTNSVETNNGKEVLAPGTSGSMGGFEISGKPEVAVKVEYSGYVKVARVGGNEGWIVNGKFYCPLQITVTEKDKDGKITNTTTVYGSACQSAEEFENAINAAIAGCSKVYEPNTDLSKNGNSIEITWAWPFSTSSANDKKDTALANDTKNAAGYWVPNQITCNVTATVTQID